MNISKPIVSEDERTYRFTLSPIQVSYANTLRRLILTGVETIAFRSDMTSTGSTTDVEVKQNDTPMTNEMLADRIGLLPLCIPDPLQWKEDQYLFVLNATGNKDQMTHVTASDFVVKQFISADDSKEEQEKQEVAVQSAPFFPPNPLTGQTCLIATLPRVVGSAPQGIHIVAKATKGTGREHARFSPVSQCSYEYTLDTNPVRQEEMFTQWLASAKKIGALEKDSERYKELKREFNTMQIKRCFQINEKGEPYSFDFTIETVGCLTVPYIVKRACEVGENMCSRYVNLQQGDVPPEITISSSDSRIIGYDFLVRGHDHTLGNLLQTWLVENHIEGTAEPKITYAGYCVPHPLRDEMVLRIGVEDGEITTARKAFAEAAKGCVQLFQNLRQAWRTAILGPAQDVKQISKLPVPKSAPVLKSAMKKP
jgi:DNA-directed RNA polymerase subunit L/DNA-directed RNA polymerase alpha subunit